MTPTDPLMIMTHASKSTATALLLSLFLVLSGCITTSVTPLTGRTYPPVHPDDVVIYVRETDVPAEYEPVALIYARGDYASTDEAMMFKSVRKKAAKLGANGVLLQDVDEPSTGAKVAHHFFGLGADRKGELLAIYVRPAEPAATAAP